MTSVSSFNNFSLAVDTDTCALFSPFLFRRVFPMNSNGMSSFSSFSPPEKVFHFFIEFFPQFCSLLFFPTYRRRSESSPSPLYFFPLSLWNEEEDDFFFAILLPTEITL